MDTDDLYIYYSRRASEYERIYEKPERQEDLAVLNDRISALLNERDVLEVACGTGYWTEVISQVARSILSIDISAEVISIAKTKSYQDNRVSFAIADANNLNDIQGRFDAGFAGFWWSHMRKQDIPSFLSTLHRRLDKGARLVFADNAYVQGSSTPIAYRDQGGNTYQDRRLNDGSVYRILKNFPSEDELREFLPSEARDVEVNLLRYYWILSYRIN